MRRLEREATDRCQGKGKHALLVMVSAFDRSPEAPITTRFSGVCRHNKAGNNACNLPAASAFDVQVNVPRAPLAVKVRRSL